MGKVQDKSPLPILFFHLSEPSISPFALVFAAHKPNGDNSWRKVIDPIEESDHVRLAAIMMITTGRVWSSHREGRWLSGWQGLIGQNSYRLCCLAYLVL